MLNVLHRNLNEQTKAIRSRGYIPAVIYSHKLDKSIPIELYKTDFKRLVETGGNTKPIDLNLDGEIKTCVITNVDIDPVKEVFLHIDFKLI